MEIKEWLGKHFQRKKLLSSNTVFNPSSEKPIKNQWWKKGRERDGGKVREKRGTKGGRQAGRYRSAVELFEKVGD